MISIITVNLNNLKGLKRTINSIKSQDNKNYEHLVIDGLSSDGSGDYIKKYKKKLFN